ncbi:MAG: rod shape-determining protein MreC [Rhodospirillaceae bacterium]|nr:rod shape-determining protein MreC [Rhodospirillaceae bacterium]
MEQRPSALLRLAAPLRSLVQRFMYLGLIAAAFGLMLVGKIDALLIDRMRAEVTNAVAPIVTALSQPLATISEAIVAVKSLSTIREENIRLAQENANLKQWLLVARKLQAENIALQTLLSSVDDRKPRYITARVVAGTRGAFANSFVINAGSGDNVRKGQAVLNDQGFVGRVSVVAKHSARVLLANDINSRVPIIIENTRTRGILAGSNTNRPKLIHLPPNARVTTSERVVTSGHGGVFPPGLPVGVVASINDGGVEVKLFADYHKMEFVRVADYGLSGFVDTSAVTPSAGGKAEKRR